MGNVSLVLSKNKIYDESLLDPTASQLVNEKISKGGRLFSYSKSARHAFYLFITQESSSWLKSYMGNLGTDEKSYSSRSGASGSESGVPPVGGVGYQLPNGTLMPIEPTGPNIRIKSRLLAEKLCVGYTKAQIRSILYVGLFTLFLDSTAYQQWMAQAAMYGHHDDDDDDDQCHSLYSSSSSTKCKKQPNQSDEEASVEAKLSSIEEEEDNVVLVNKTLMQIIRKVIKTTTFEEIDRTLFDGSWLTNFLAAVDTLPLCVSISSVIKHGGKGSFPLIYINKKFEETTQYCRSEIVGKNCRFLQCDETEEIQIKKLSEALRTAQPVKVALTNVKKDGSKFFNLLAMKPVFDADEQYSFVIGVQYSIAQRSASAKELHMVDELLTLLPNVFY